MPKSTFTPGVLSEIGSFGGLFRLDRERFEDPVLVSSADGVGTKLKVAFMTGRHDTVGGDLVNHCVNDILVQGAEPLFFLDYLATGRLDPTVAEQVVGGIARACRENALRADRRRDRGDARLLRGRRVRHRRLHRRRRRAARESSTDGRIVPGDVLIGLPSAGLHTNGYSLARRVFFEIAGWKANTYVGGLGKSDRRRVAGAAPIVFESLEAGDRTSLGERARAYHRRRHHRKPARASCRKVAARKSTHEPGRSRRFFECCSSVADIAGDEMFRAFNMGIGLVVACATRDADRVLNTIRTAGEGGAGRIGFASLPASAAFDTSKKMHLAFCIQLRPAVLRC